MARGNDEVGDSQEVSHLFQSAPGPMARGNRCPCNWLLDKHLKGLFRETLSPVDSSV